MIHRLYVNAVGFVAPGFDSAEALDAHISGAPCRQSTGWSPAPTSLSRRQALRLSDATRLAILAAEQIAEAMPVDAGWVFASSVGEGQTLNEILMALSQDETMIQPLRFQNAVHNAAQGQWSIVAGSESPATSIAAYDNTVGAALLKAMMQAVIEKLPVGLVVYDAPQPPPLHVKRPFACPMAAALALSPGPWPESRAVLEIALTSAARPTMQDDLPIAESLLRGENPVRFTLPLLREVFQPSGRQVTLALNGGSGLEVRVMHINNAA